MELSLLLEYGWVLIVLIFMEGLLSADNALVLAIMSKHLPEEQQKKAINIGLLLAFIFRIGAIFIISFLYHVWQVQAVGGSLFNLYRIKAFTKKAQRREREKGKSYRMTVAQIALADIAFAVDSILAAVAFVIALPDTPMGNIGGMDGAKFIVIKKKTEVTNEEK